ASSRDGWCAAIAATAARPSRPVPQTATDLPRRSARRTASHPHRRNEQRHRRISIARRSEAGSVRVGSQFEVMRFPAYTFDPSTGEARFDYLLDGPAPERFTETITFPVSDRPVPQAFHRVLDLLHVVAGVSYYKIGAPHRIEAPRPVPAEAAALFTAVYTHGLAEYAYRNDLPFVLHLVVRR